MQLAIIENGQVTKIGHYKELFPNVSFPTTGPDAEFLTSNSALEVTVFKPYDSATQRLVPVEPHIEGQYVYTVSVEDKSQDEIDRELESSESKRIESLWNAATNYEKQFISGSAVGLITLGVVNSKPKALAVQGWIQSIWTEYYLRKSNKSIDTDFSFIGPCPHSVPELMSEM